jgi:hypothetical protein
VDQALKRDPATSGLPTSALGGSAESRPMGGDESAFYLTFSGESPHARLSRNRASGNPWAVHSEAG